MMTKEKVLDQLQKLDVSAELLATISDIDSVHFNGKFNYDKEFGNIRKSYQLGSNMFKLGSPFIKKYFSRHDLLASDDNINPDYWNDHIFIMRKSYQTAFKHWCSYMYNEGCDTDFPMLKGKKRYSGREGCYNHYYNLLSQRSVRLLIDLIQTMMLEDTIYRELFSFWLFELQYEMNKKFNPEIQQVHVLYTNVLANDQNYLAMQQVVGKSRRMSSEFHTAANDRIQKVMDTQRKNDVLSNKSD